MICNHKELSSSCKVVKIEEGDYVVELSVWCAACYKPLQFVGMPAGVSFSAPAVSPDECEARLPAKLIS